MRDRGRERFENEERSIVRENEKKKIIKVRHRDGN